MAERLVLRVEDLCAGYRGVAAARNITISVEPGDVHALLGPNGSGKSTVLRATSGVLPHFDGEVFSGRILLLGRDVGETRPHDRVKLGMTHVPDGGRVFPQFTVRKNITLGSFSSGGRDTHVPDMDEILALFPPLESLLNRRAGTLSGGERQMVALARGLTARPRVMLLDEPTAGLSPNYAKAIMQSLLDSTRSGLGCLLVEQNAGLALKYATHATILQYGRIAFQGPVKNIEDMMARLKLAPNPETRCLDARPSGH